jgi:hypothetical protein
MRCVDRLENKIVDLDVAGSNPVTRPNFVAPSAVGVFPEPAMADEPENLVLRALREIRDQNDTILRKLDEGVVRLGAVERDLAAMKVDYSAMQVRFAG